MTRADGNWTIIKIKTRIIIKPNITKMICFQYCFHMMNRNVFIGFVNHKNEVSGRIGGGNSSGPSRPKPAGSSSASFSVNK